MGFPMFIYKCLFEAEWSDQLSFPAFWKQLTGWVELCSKYCPDATSSMFKVVAHLVGQETAPDDEAATSSSSGLPDTILASLTITHQVFVYQSAFRGYRQGLFSKSLQVFRTDDELPTDAARGKIGCHGQLGTLLEGRRC